jgi:orotidine-5'-phosphate decarboxylase
METDYTKLLKQKAEETNSIVCMGLDPVLKKIPLEGDPGEVITKFYLDILEAIKSEGVMPATAKPNIAFYAQYGFEGLKALKRIMEEYKKAGIQIILDAKRGDIGKTSAAYAKELFNFWQADAITVAPYMGSDSVEPFFEYCTNGRGVYMLVRTSNKGAVDMQDLEVDNIPIYMKVAKKLVEWHRPGVCAVVGATYPAELEKISKFFVESGKEVPLLIPGVGAQGGSALDVVAALKKTGNDIRIHRINSSSGINYAYEEKGTDDYAGAAVKAIKELNREIGL